MVAMGSSVASGRWRPSEPSKARKKVLDPRIITATRPQDVVREVMQRTSINRTTAQR